MDFGYEQTGLTGLSFGPIDKPLSECSTVIHIENDDIKDEVRPPPHFRGFKQTIPSSSLRYSKNEIAFPNPLVFHPDMVLSSTNCTTSTLIVSRLEPYTQDGWQSYTHPEGLKYYYHTQCRVLTDANLQIPFTYTRVNDWMNDLFQIINTCSIHLPPSYEIVLELYPDYTCGYYAVDNEKQTIFFFDSADTAELGLPDVVSTEHLKLQLHRQYWRHMEYFPAHRPAPKSAQNTLTAILSHAWVDGTTSNLSTSPHSPEACQEFLQIIQNFTGKPEQEVYRTCIIGRLMDEFTQARFINLYGEDRGVRLANNQSVYYPESEKLNSSTIYNMASIMLLRQPDTELDRLNNLWVDKVAYTSSWRRFIKERIDEWKNVITISIGFTLIDILLVLALRSYASTSIWSDYFPQVMAYQLAVMSLVLNMCSTIVGLVAISVHSPHHNSTASNAASYFTNAWHNTYGFKPLAIALSIPRSLATWALAGTTLSIAALSLESLNLLTLLFTGSFTVLLGAVTVWAIAFFQIGDNSFGITSLINLLTRRY